MAGYSLGEKCLPSLQEALRSPPPTPISKRAIALQFSMEREKGDRVHSICRVGNCPPHDNAKKGQSTT
ncbi:MAG: hypothetical protein AB4042_15320 [Leptolyngbyaceae cyanobacterium]